jgi:hypothetical protein
VKPSKILGILHRLPSILLGFTSQYMCVPECYIYAKRYTWYEFLWNMTTLFQHPIINCRKMPNLCFSPGPLVSPTNKPDRHDITEILLKVQWLLAFLIWTKILWGEAKQNTGDSTQTPMYINLFDIYQQKLNIADTKSYIQFDFRKFI